MSRNTNGAGFLLLIVVVVFAALIVDFHPVEINQNQRQTAERPNDWFGNGIYKSVNGAEFWQPISPTLTQGWSFLTAIGLSSSDNQVVYAGGA